MKSKAKIHVVLAVIVSLGLAACAGSQPAPSLGGVDITGVWYMASYTTYLQLNEDGTFRFAHIQQQTLEEAPTDEGQYRLEGTSLTFISSNESQDCAGQSGSYQVELTEVGQLRFVLQEDPCWERTISLRYGPYDRVEPLNSRD